jgi:integrase
MGRPPLPLGTWGKIGTRQIDNTTWRAVANYKDYDDVTRRAEKVGASASKAANNLREALRDRARQSTAGEITPDTTVGVAADLWLRTIDESDKATRTKREYRDTWNRYLVAPMGQLRVRDVRVSTVNRVITEVRDRNGRGAAMHVRTVLSGIFGLVVRHDALDENPVREIEGLGKKKRKTARMVNAATIGPALGVFHASEKAAGWDLVDMIDALSGLGCRIGELLALDWKTSINFDHGTIYFHGTLIRVAGQGLVVQDHTKSPAGMRTIRPPAWVMEILKRRYAESSSEWAFPSTRGTLRDPDNTRKYIRNVVAGTPFEGLHPHDFRHYIAGILDDAGLTARQIADYLGHERISTTQEEYMERGVVGELVGPALANQPTAQLPKRAG